MATKDFAEKIYSLRTARGLSQKELGDLLGVSNKAVSKWETGDSMPKTATLVKIADTFGIDISELMGAETRDPLPDNTAQLDSLKAENALLRSQITASDKHKKRRTVAAVIIGIVAIACAGIFAFLTGTSADNKGIKDLGKDGTYVDFAGKKFEPFGPLDELVYKETLNYHVFSDTKEAKYTDSIGTKSKILINCDSYYDFIGIEQGSKNYFYIADDAHIRIDKKTINNIYFNYGDSVSKTDNSGGFDYVVTAKEGFDDCFADFYKDKKETADKRAAELFMGNKGFSVEIEFDEEHDFRRFKIGEFFLGKDDRVYFYDYSDAKTYDVGKEMAEYVKGN